MFRDGVGYDLQKLIKSVDHTVRTVLTGSDIRIGPNRVAVCRLIGQRKLVRFSLSRVVGD